jgi:maltodextrin utilization protein YvdJ
MLLLACSVCFGQSDSPLAQGTNMAIFFMLAVTGVMLASFAGFFIYLIRRKRLFADDNMPEHERTV